MTLCDSCYLRSCLITIRFRDFHAERRKRGDRKDNNKNIIGPIDRIDHPVCLWSKSGMECYRTLTSLSSRGNILYNAICNHFYPLTFCHFGSN